MTRLGPIVAPYQRDNLAASTAPTVNDDSGDGYSVGSRWIDTTNDLEYVCVDASAGAAVWSVTSTSPDLFIGPPHNALINNGATNWATANAARLYAFRVVRPVMVTTAYFRVTVQAGNMDVGIYSDAGMRLASTGSFAMPAAAQTCSQALTGSVTLVPGVRYWAAMACSDATARVSGFLSNSRPDVPGQIMGGQVLTSLPLPDPIVIPTAEGSYAHYVGIWFA